MNNKLKVYYDAEFTGLFKDTSLVSIALVTEDDNYFYAEFTDYDKDQVDEWLKKNVIDNLLFNNEPDGYHIKMTTHTSHHNIEMGDKFERYNVVMKSTKEIIGNTLVLWLQDIAQYHRKQIQIYCDCYAYDWMLFNDLICKDGKALNLPNFVYYIPMDLSTTLQLQGYDPDITREEFITKETVESIKDYSLFDKMDGNFKHNALWDTYVARACFNELINECF